jgi:hypothetical protein
MVDTTRYHKFHANVRRVYGDRNIEKGLTEGRITQDDADLIREYVTEARALMNQYVLVNWRRFLTKPYHTCSIADVYAAIDTLKSARSQRGTPFAQNTKHDYVKVLKPFLLWLIENEYSSLPEKKVQKIKRPPKNTLARRHYPKCCNINAPLSNCCTVCGRVLNIDGRTEAGHSSPPGGDGVDALN